MTFDEWCEKNGIDLEEFKKPGMRLDGYMTALAEALIGYTEDSIKEIRDGDRLEN